LKKKQSAKQKSAKNKQISTETSPKISNLQAFKKTCNSTKKAQILGKTARLATLQPTHNTTHKQHTRDDRIVDFYYPILSCFWKMISVSDPNLVFVETILSLSKHYPKAYCDAQHTFLCCVYFAS